MTEQSLPTEPIESTQAILTITRTEQPPPPLPSADDDEMVLMARYPHQMEACQKQLIEWCDRKIATMQAEADDLGENYEIAVRNKWGASGIKRALDLANKRYDYYRKMKEALEAGYCIVPNFPVDVIAIRTKRKKPDAMESQASTWQTSREQKAQLLIPREGEFKNPEPLIASRTLPTQDQQGNTVQKNYHFADAFSDFIDFPFVLAKPEILKATERAMTEKIFDDIGVLPGRKKKREDPIIVGRIHDPRSDTYNKRFVTFLIAWFVDTRAL